MKKNKWLSILSLAALLVTGTFLFASCGGDDDNTVLGGTAGTVVAPTQSQLLGTWTITSSTVPVGVPGPAAGTQVFFATDGSVKMKYASASSGIPAGTVFNGTYTYSASTGNLRMTMPQPVGIVDVVLVYAGSAVYMSYTEDGVVQTAVLVKTSPNDIIGGDNPQPQQPDVDDSPLAGTWTVSNTEEASELGRILSIANGVCTVENEQYTINWRRDDNGRILLELYQNGNKECEGKFSVVQDGNVLTGELHFTGKQKKGYTLTKQGFSVPSVGIMGRWQVSSVNFDGPSVGTVLVFGADNVMYIENDYHVDSYIWNPAGTLSIILEEEGELTGWLNVNGWTTGSIAVWTSGDFALSFIKL